MLYKSYNICTVIRAWQFELITCLATLLTWFSWRRGATCAFCRAGGVIFTLLLHAVCTRVKIGRNIYGSGAARIAVAG